jgi:hypothetical protein
MLFYLPYVQDPLMLNLAEFQNSLYYLYNDTYVQHYEAVNRTCGDLALEDRTGLL